MSTSNPLDFLYKLIATQYPGATRILSVNLVALICSVSTSDFFAASMFTMSFMVSMSGTAVATQAYVENRELSTFDSVCYVVVLTVFSAPFGFMLWDGSHFQFFMIVIFSIFYSMSEIIRSQLMSKGRFKDLAVRGMIGCFFILISVFTFQNYEILVTGAIILSSFITISYGGGIVRISKGLRKNITKDIFSYSISNIFSTGFSFLFPLFLISEFGESSATTIAQVFTCSFLFYSYPRLLSATFLSEYKLSENKYLYADFDRKCNKFILISIFFIGFFIYVLKPMLEPYFVFIIALVCSQLSLPASNLIMMKGRGGILLKVNIVSLVLLMVSVGLQIFMFAPSNFRTQLILFSYLMYHLARYFYLKFFITKSYQLEYIGRK